MALNETLPVHSISAVAREVCGEHFRHGKGRSLGQFNAFVACAMPAVNKQ